VGAADAGGSGEANAAAALGGCSGAGWWRYSGEWCDGLREGAGTLQLADGSSYSGGFRHDLPAGEGAWLLRGPGAGGGGPEWQVRYEGEWLAGLRHGEGLEALPVARPDTQQPPESSAAFGTAALVPGAVFSRQGPWFRGAAVAGAQWQLAWAGLDTAPRNTAAGTDPAPSVFGGYGHADEAAVRGFGLGGSGAGLGRDRTYSGAATAGGYTQRAHVFAKLVYSNPRFQTKTPPFTVKPLPLL
jgi:hypothetical protein